MNELEKQTEKYQQDVKEWSEAREDSLTVRTDFTVAALGSLEEKLFEGVDNLSEVISKKDYYDKNLGTTIKELIQSVITEFANQKAPNIEFKPQIKVDLAPLQSMVSSLSNQNNTLINIANKLLLLNGDDKLHNLIVLLAAQQKAFLDKELKEIDYSEKLQAISDGLKKNNDVVEKLVVNRGEQNLIQSVTPIYKTNTK